MPDMIDITIPKGRRTHMIEEASKQLKAALSGMEPPFNERTDILRLGRYASQPSRVKLSYNVFRDSLPSKKDQNKSPYRETGFHMHVRHLP